MATQAKSSMRLFIAGATGGIGRALVDQEEVAGKTGEDLSSLGAGADSCIGVLIRIACAPAHYNAFAWAWGRTDVTTAVSC
ncbi:MAG TPA: hypothetical protein VKU41_32360 [Polyangiaceae bacterium]|nr:hypothetical protein [Polyangiaceae bacterium]